MSPPIPEPGELGPRASTLTLWAADAVIFDMDGVVTDTASLHADAWAALFDSYLAGLGTGPHRPFSHDDYLRHVDGRARIDGVVTFLRSRSLEVPLGNPSDPPTADTAWALANRKNDYFLAAIERLGVQAFPATIDLLHELRGHGVRTAVVTASRNADRILAACSAAALFDARVDGTIAEAAGLAGKPDPATFLEAARLLGAAPAHSVVIEDALAGVEAGRRGGFGLVIGIDRSDQTDHAEALSRAGADLVVGDLGQLPRRGP